MVESNQDRRIWIIVQEDGANVFNRILIKSPSVKKTSPHLRPSMSSEGKHCWVTTSSWLVNWVQPENWLSLLFIERNNGVNNEMR
jgi:hypothetical protein